MGTKVEPFFEISGDDVARLDDASLRELIGLLCEADFRAGELATSGITWSGHQDAPDGGFDVVIESDSPPPKTSQIKRKHTGIQVKKPDMPPSKIRKEMCPSGQLRDEIRGLIELGGSYLIVSSGGSTSASSLKRRKAEMRSAVNGADKEGKLHLDFFDRGGVATWVRSHPSLIVWVRNKIGRQFKGWRPFENWALAPAGVDEEYLLDERLRLLDGTRPSDGSLSCVEGIGKLRSILASPRRSVRLAGLSGVGKTRLVQALFDDRIGDHPLNKTHAFYTDIADSPSPDPKTLAEQLIANCTRAVLVIDNCPPDLHRRLTAVCTKAASTVSLISIEYDVRDDLPNETSVFRMEPASNELIGKLIRLRFSHIGQVGARKIAEFSEGNAKLAIALANTLKSGETLSGFRDDELFDRLFRQGNDPSDQLMVSGEVASLVYSFDGEDTTSDKSELTILASIISKSSDELYRCVAELRSRDLVQSRSKWRAVLPQAVANRLAAKALKNISRSKVANTILGCGSTRLIKSFSRRLNFLHDCAEAIAIAESWLADGGWLGDVRTLNDFGISIFENISPVSPLKALEAIERAARGVEGEEFTSRKNLHYYRFATLLRLIAYDSAHFRRCIRIMVRFALSEKADENVNSTRQTLKSLFYITLSGTWAPPDERLAVIKGLCKSKDTSHQDLGLLLLDAALEAWHFRSFGPFDFGARPRDYGYQPAARSDIVHWYSIFITEAEELALSGGPISEKARRLMARSFRELWTKGGMFDELEAMAARLHSDRPWNEGWVAVRETLYFDAKVARPAFRERLQALDHNLHPRDLIEKARTYILTDQDSRLDFVEEDDDIEKGESHAVQMYEKVNNIAVQIGAQVACEEQVLTILLPELVSGEGQRLQLFGRGMAEGSFNRGNLWNRLKAEFEKTEKDRRNISVMLGFLAGAQEADHAFCGPILDELIKDDCFGEWLPLLQIAVSIDASGLERIHASLDLGFAPIWRYRQLAFGRTHEAIDDDKLALLLHKIAAQPDGSEVATEILGMRFHGAKENGNLCGYSLIRFGREALMHFEFSRDGNRTGSLDYRFSVLVNFCMLGEDSKDAAITMLNNLKPAISEGRIHAGDFPRLLAALARLHPTAFLDAFLSGDDRSSYRICREFVSDLDRRENPLSQITDDVIIAWCDVDPDKRYVRIADVLHCFTRKDEAGRYEWKQIFFRIVDRAPDLAGTLEQIEEAIFPMSWSGSRADTLEERLTLFPPLFNHHNSKIRTWAKRCQERVKECIVWDREDEEKRRRERDERFE